MRAHCEDVRDKGIDKNIIYTCTYESNSASKDQKLEDGDETLFNLKSPHRYWLFVSLPKWLRAIQGYHIQRVVSACTHKQETVSKVLVACGDSRPCRGQTSYFTQKGWSKWSELGSSYFGALQKSKLDQFLIKICETCLPLVAALENLFSFKEWKCKKQRN